MTPFELHPRLEQDSLLLGQLPLCQVRLLNDSQYPWLVLIPKRVDITEIHHLTINDQQQLMTESCQVAQLMEDAVSPDKINIGALGNLVPQLHVHHVARFKDDAAWPGPIWGALPPRAYGEAALADQMATWKQRLTNLKAFKPA